MPAASAYQNIDGLHFRRPHIPFAATSEGSRPFFQALHSWKTIQPREFEFLQKLMATRQESMTDQDSLAAAPQALRLFAEARVALDLAVEVGCIRFDPDRPGDDGMSRTVRWMAALEGAVMVSNAFAGVEYLDPESFDMKLIALRSVSDLLFAWGAEPEVIEAGAQHIEVLRRDGRLLPESI